MSSTEVGCCLKVQLSSLLVFQAMTVRGLVRRLNSQTWIADSLRVPFSYRPGLELAVQDSVGSVE